MLTHPAIGPYLIEHEYLNTRYIIEGIVQISEASHRNLNFSVVSEQGPSYLVKQAIGDERVASVKLEAEVYELLQRDSRYTAFRRYLPRVYGYREPEHLLILELLRDALTLEEYHYRLGRFSTRTAGAVGAALAALHRAAGDPGELTERHPKLPARPMPVLSIHRPDLNYYGSSSNANVQLITIIQRFPEFCALLDDLRMGWRSDRLIHGDVRWGNWLLHRPDGSHRRQLKLVDWEFASVGDPCWDVGSAFSSYLSFWLLSIPITGSDPPERYLELARYPLAKMQPAIRALWSAYVRGMALDPQTADEWLLRSVRYCAARLVQEAFEHGHIQYQVTGNLICLLQVSLNILQRPQEAAMFLLGIPLGSRLPA